MLYTSSMRYVIIGAGKVGVEVAKSLSEKGHKVTILDKDRKKILKIQNRLDCTGLVDDGQKQQVLKDAKVDEADYFIAATDSDEVNLICCSTIREIEPKAKDKKVKCVARIRSEQYLENLESFKKSFNVHQVVQPEREIATAIVRSIEYGGGISDVFLFVDFKQVIIRSYKVQSDFSFIGITLRDFSKKIGLSDEVSKKMRVVMVMRDEEFFIPSGEYTFTEKDELYFIGSSEVLGMLSKKLEIHSKEAKDIRKIMIIGGGAITKRILDIYFSKTNDFKSLIGKDRTSIRDIVVVESNEAICEELSESFPGTTIINADVTDDQMLEDVEISSADLVIATTESQELNIVVAAHSHNEGVSQTIAVVNSEAYSKIAEGLGISNSFSLRKAVADSMMQYLQETDSDTETKTNTEMSIRDGKLRTFIHKVDSESYALGKMIKDLKLPKNSLIVCINRKEGSSKEISFVAQGESKIHDQDQLLIVSTEDASKEIKKLFPPKTKTEPKTDKEE